MKRDRSNVAGAVLGLVLALGSAGLAQLDATTADDATRAGVARRSSSVPAAVDELLGQVEVAPEGPREGYSRSRFPHWSDLDGDGCDAREEVLAAERTAGTVRGCAVRSGRWESAYDGRSFSRPGDLDIDHFVPLGEAWDSGAAAWDDERRRRYANDEGYQDALIAVSAASNRQKGDKDPNQWRPPLESFWCEYATAWTTVKIRWGLTADEAEVAALRDMFAACRSAPSTAVTLAR